MKASLKALLKALDNQFVVISDTKITIATLRKVSKIEFRQDGTETWLYLDNQVVEKIKNAEEKILPELYQVCNNLRTYFGLSDLLGVYSVVNKANYVNFFCLEDAEKIRNRFILNIVLEQRVKISESHQYKLKDYIEHAHRLDSDNEGCHDTNSSIVYLHVCSEELQPLVDSFHDKEKFHSIINSIKQLYELCNSEKSEEVIKHISESEYLAFLSPKYIKELTER